MWTSYVQPWIYPVLFLIYAATIVSCIAVVLSEKRNPIKSLAWVIALVFLPIVGLIFYLFFGRSLKNKRMISRHNKRKLLSKQHTPAATYSPDKLQANSRLLTKLASSLGATPLSYATSMEIFTEGKGKFEALKRDLTHARRSIYLQYYIFADDNLGREIADILIKKAQEGVKVRVIYDHVGSFSTRNKFFERMRQAGVEAHPFFRVTFKLLANRINWRNHRKVVIIDDTIGYVGGMNIADRYVRGLNEGESWRDTHLRVEGPVVGGMIYSFAVDWNFLKHHTDIKPIETMLTEPAPEVKLPAQFITSGPTDHWPAIAYLFQRAILSARKCVYIQTPYFLPTDALLKALQTAALTRIDVRVMLPATPDSMMLRYASFSYITECLQAGIKVYLYNPGMLHAKTLIIDNEFCSIGSTNFDFRSFEHNFEGNMLIYDSRVSHELKDQFFKDIQHSYKLTLNTWLQRPRALRFGESVIRLFAPIL
ncbi:MAG: cardiolipin synthase [Prevotella sp.]|nr:cardiolipin synthase [Prevotella sp.]MCM1074206.1 cardiolipin synthase [Ruminococcus sp.]